MVCYGSCTATGTTVGTLNSRLMSADAVPVWDSSESVVTLNSDTVSVWDSSETAETLYSNAVPVWDSSKPTGTLDSSAVPVWDSSEPVNIVTLDSVSMQVWDSSEPAIILDSDAAPVWNSSKATATPDLDDAPVSNSSRSTTTLASDTIPVRDDFRTAITLNLDGVPVWDSSTPAATLASDTVPSWDCTKPAAPLDSGTVPVQDSSGSVVSIDSPFLPVPVLSSKHPPCKVCGGKGSGMHYGLNTCEACKSFFGKYHLRKTHVKCLKQGDCPVRRGQMKCPPCRFQKCVNLGMSLKGIRIGRSNYMQVTAAIEEVKKLELQLKIKQDGSIVSPEDHLVQMDMITNKLTNTHFGYASRSADFFATILEREQQFLEQKTLEEQLFGKRNTLQRSQYNQIYSQTQLDVDGRRSIVQALTPLMYHEIRNMFTFASSIPGFKSLSRNDQYKVLKAGTAETSAFLHYSTYNADHGLYVYHLDTSIVLSKDAMMGYVDGPSDLHAILQMLARRAQDLELTHEENVLTAALCLMLTDTELSAVGQNIVMASAESLSETLYHVLQQNHDTEEHTYAKLITLLTEVKTAMIEQRQHYSNMAEDSRDMELPDTWVDMFASYR